MLTLERLKKIDDRICNEINEFADRNGLSTSKSQPIYDGLYSAEMYWKSPLRIMWILKEPYDEFDKRTGKPEGGAWSITKDLFHNPEDFARNKTGQMVIYTSYGILNNLKWNKIDYIYDDPDIPRILQTIAFINLSKMPAYTTTRDSELWAKYEDWKKITLKQIKQYEPNVLIFGNTFKFFYDDLYELFSIETTKKTYLRNIDIRVYENEERIIIDSWHPGKHFSNEEKEIYVNSLVRKINNWYSSITQMNSSFESKYLFISKLADFLISNRIKMNSADLINFLNTNNFTTSNEVPYSSTQSVNNLLRECYQKADAKTKKMIKNAFVNNKGNTII